MEDRWESRLKRAHQNVADAHYQLNNAMDYYLAVPKHSCTGLGIQSYRISQLLQTAALHLHILTGMLQERDAAKKAMEDAETESWSQRLYDGIADKVEKQRAAEEKQTK